MGCTMGCKMDIPEELLECKFVNLLEKELDDSDKIFKITDEEFNEITELLKDVPLEDDDD